MLPSPILRSQTNKWLIVKEKNTPPQGMRNEVQRSFHRTITFNTLDRVILKFIRQEEASRTEGGVVAQISLAREKREVFLENFSVLQDCQLRR